MGIIHVTSITGPTGKDVTLSIVRPNTNRRTHETISGSRPIPTYPLCPPSLFHFDGRAGRVKKVHHDDTRPSSFRAAAPLSPPLRPSLLSLHPANANFCTSEFPWCRETHYLVQFQAPAQPWTIIAPPPPQVQENAIAGMMLMAPFKNKNLSTHHNIPISTVMSRENHPQQNAVYPLVQPIK